METVRDLVGEDGERFVNQVSWAAEVKSALERLPVEQQEAIELSYFADLSQPEIAAHLGIPIGTVKARMARGMRRLAAIVEGQEFR